MYPLKIWHKLTGEPGIFSMENRVYNSVSVITMLLLIIFLPFNIITHLYDVVWLLLSMLAIQFFFYYLARFKKMLRISIIAYAFFSYVALCINFFINSGSNGPTLIVFFVTFMLLTTLTRRKDNWIWIVLHITVATALLLAEHYHPGWVPNTYSYPRYRFMDMMSSYVIAILFIFFTTTYLKRSYQSEKDIAEERATENQRQNELIREQKNELEKLNKEKDKIFSVISHDLRSPLNSIIGYLELIKDGDLSQTEKDEMKAMLLDTTRNTSDMVFNLLSWSKTQMKGVNTKIEVLNLNENIQIAVTIQNATAANKKISIVFEPNEAIQVLADKEMFQLVIRNLISNAIKYTPSGGVIHILASHNNKLATICVKDSGQGIPPHMQSGIFSPQIISTQGTNNEKGIGLGLLLCKEFIEHQKGRIWFKSEPGAGTEFYISLALAQ